MVDIFNWFVVSIFVVPWAFGFMFTLLVTIPTYLCGRIKHGPGYELSNGWR